MPWGRTAPDRRRLAGTTRSEFPANLRRNEHGLCQLFLRPATIEERCTRRRTMHVMKRSECCHLAIGLLHPVEERSASDALLQSADLGGRRRRTRSGRRLLPRASLRPPLGSPFLFAAVGAKTKRIEIGTACGMRMHCTWRKTPARPILLPADAGSWASARFSRAGDRWMAYFGYVPRRRRGQTTYGGRCAARASPG
jgi:hypothetical protein